MTKTRAKKETRSVVPRSIEGTRTILQRPLFLSYDKFYHRRDRRVEVEGETLCAHKRQKSTLCKENVTTARK